MMHMRGLVRYMDSIMMYMRQLMIQMTRFMVVMHMTNVRVHWLHWVHSWGRRMVMHHRSRRMMYWM